MGRPKTPLRNYGSGNGRQEAACDASGFNLDAELRRILQVQHFEAEKLFSICQNRLQELHGEQRDIQEGFLRRLLSCPHVASECSGSLHTVTPPPIAMPLDESDEDIFEGNPMALKELPTEEPLPPCALEPLPLLDHRWSTAQGDLDCSCCNAGSSAPVLHVHYEQTQVSTSNRSSEASLKPAACAEVAPLNVPVFDDVVASEPSGVEKKVPESVSFFGGVSFFRDLTGVSGVSGSPKPALKMSRSKTVALISRKVPIPWLSKITSGTPYTSFCSLIIIFNIAFVGVREDLILRATISEYEAGSLAQSWLEIFAMLVVIDVVFCIWFTMELAITFAANPRGFLNTENWRWNLFDSTLVIIQLLEQILRMPDVSYIRILRIFRTARVLRVIKVFRFFASLRLMVFAICESFIALLWAFVLLGMIMYVFAIFFIGAAENYIHNTYRGDPLAADLTSLWGGLETAWMSLFMSISGGMDWADVVRPLEQVTIWYKYVFLVFIFFTTFGVLNVVIGAFVDSFAVVSQRDKDSIIADEMKREKKHIRHIMDIFEGADTDDSGCLSLEEFENHLKDKRVKAFFGTLGLDISRARELFYLLDTDRTDSVGIDEFVQGCMRLKGDAKSIDVNMLLYENQLMIKRINELTAEITGSLNKIERRVSLVPCNVAASQNVAMLE